MDPWQGIEVFTAVAEQGSFTAAARVNGVSVSYVSRQVERLEQRLGMRLFNRSTRRVRLTEAGQLYYRRCADLAAGLEEANQEIAGLGSEPRGTIRISAAGPFAERYVAPACAAFMMRYEEIAIELDFSPRLVNLIDDGFDLAVRFGAPKDSTLVARKLAPRTMALAASPAYLNRFGSPQTPEDLLRHNCLMGNFDRWRFQYAEGIREIKVRGRWRSRNTGDALVAAASQGLGIVYLPIYNLQAQLDDGSLKRLLTDFMVQDMATWLVYPHRQYLPLRVKLLVEFLMAHFKDWRE